MSEIAINKAQRTDVVIDTQIVLDLLLFADASTWALRLALDAGMARWLATSDMRSELARVLGYASMQQVLHRRTLHAHEVLDRFDQGTCLVAAAAPAEARCRDADDQCFIDLAVAYRARLLSRDRAVLALQKKLGLVGVAVAQAWT
ncbi:MAG: PIN domain-containing protein [Variovorax sp.]